MCTHTVPAEIDLKGKHARVARDKNARAADLRWKWLW